MPENRIDTMAIKVNGRALDTALYELLTLVRVEESVQLPDMFELRFDDPHFELFDRATFTMGAEIEIAFRSEGDMTVVTTAEITAISVEQGATGRHELVLTGLDAAHRLHRGPKSRTFVQMTDADVATQIAGEYNLSTDIDTTREVHEHVFQSNQTDMEFLTARAQRIGFDVWVTGDELHFKERPRASAAPTLTWGENLHRFKVRFSSTERSDRVTVRGWDPIAKQEIIGRADRGDTGTTASAADEIADEARSAFGSVERAAGHFPVASQAEADAMAASLLLRASGGEVVVRGEAAGDPRLAAGADAEIAHVGSRLSGRYLVTSVQHIYGAGSPYVTRFVCGAKDPVSLVDLVGGGNGGAMKKGWGSLVMATVTQIDDPQSVGRVKVKFVDLDDTESAWAPVVSVGAGNERGLYVLPEVGDTVLVGFEHDDKRRPVVLGSLWNTPDPPPDQAAVGRGEVVNRTWHSRNGHHLTFVDDTPGALELGLGDAECTLRMEESESSLRVAQKLVIEGMEIEITGTSKLVLSAPNVEINGDATVKVSGGVIQLN